MIDLTTRKNKEIRNKQWIKSINNHIQHYIKNGSKGDLDLEDTPITCLPNNLLNVGGSLILSYSNITKLPSKLRIHKSLWIVSCPLTTLPDDIYIGGYLWYIGSGITLSDYEIEEKFKIKKAWSH